MPNATSKPVRKTAKVAEPKVQPERASFLATFGGLLGLLLVAIVLYLGASFVAMQHSALPAGAKLIFSETQRSSDGKQSTSDLYAYSIASGKLASIYHTAGDPQKDGAVNFRPFGADKILVDITKYPLGDRPTTTGSLLSLTGRLLGAAPQTDERNEPKALSQDGTLAAYTAEDQQSIIVQDLKTGEKKNYPIALNGNQFYPKEFSWDNKTLYLENQSDPSTPYVLAKINLETADIQELKALNKLGVYSPNLGLKLGKFVTAQYPNSGLPAEGGRPTNKVVLVDVATGNTETLLPEKEFTYYGGTYLSPDGKTVIVSIEDKEGSGLWKFSVDNPSDIVKFPQTAEFDQGYVVAWSPDSRYLLMTAIVGQGADSKSLGFTLVDMTTGKVKVVHEPGDVEQSFVGFYQ